jgi:hypothetical protein
MTTRSSKQGQTIRIGLLILLSANSAFAHHSFAMFDMKKEMTITGVVKDFQWTNPHIWIDVLTKDSSNKEIVYSVECGPTGMSLHSGWTRNSFKAGDQVTIVVHPLRDGAVGGSFVSAVVNGVRLGNGETRPTP